MTGDGKKQKHIPMPRKEKKRDSVNEDRMQDNTISLATEEKSADVKDETIPR
jgi:hypothetical protein